MQLKPGICPCRRQPTQFPKDFAYCPSCDHPRAAHSIAGCVDGIDHPGSVGLIESTPHGPSAEQFARGVAMLVDALGGGGIEWVAEYILNGE